MEARWPRYDAEPIDYTTGALNVAAVLIPHRETIPPGRTVSINVAIKFEGKTACYGFTGAMPWETRDSGGTASSGST